MELDITLAISIWKTDNGYRTINSFLTKSTSRKDYIYHRENNKSIEYLDKTYNTIDVINIIKQNMKKSDELEPIMYYRGGSAIFTKSFINPAFTSVCSNLEQAGQYVDGDCCLYKVFVDPSIKRYDTGIEFETLLEPDLYWEYIGKKGKFHIVNIKQPHEMNLNIEATTEDKNHELIEDKKHELTENELKSWLDVYKEEYLLFDDEPSPEGFINYIKKENESLYINNDILIQRLADEMMADEMISKIGGKKRKQLIKTIKKRKPKKIQKTKRYKKLNPKSKKIEKTKSKK